MEIGKMIKNIRVILFLLMVLIINFTVFFKVEDPSRLINIIMSMFGFIIAECVIFVGITLSLKKHVTLFNCWKLLLELFWKFLFFVFFIFAFIFIYLGGKAFVLLPLVIDSIFIMYIVWLYCCNEGSTVEKVKAVSVFGQVKKYYRLLAVNFIVVPASSLLTIYVLSNDYCSKNIMFIVFVGISISLLLYNISYMSRTKK